MGKALILYLVFGIPRRSIIVYFHGRNLRGPRRKMPDNRRKKKTKNPGNSKAKERKADFVLNMLRDRFPFLSEETLQKAFVKARRSLQSSKNPAEIIDLAIRYLE